MERINTAKQRVFRPAGREGPIFDFSSPHNIEITVLKGSDWRTEFNWHDHKSSGKYIECLQGHLLISYSGGSNGGSKGFRYSFPSEDRHSWSCDSLKENLIVLLAANEVLYRNRCIAILDADRFPVLATTPIWLRALFRIVSLLPSVYEWLLLRMLWIQIQAINYPHGYFTIHGQIPLVKVWRYLHAFDQQPPRWISHLQSQSLILFSKNCSRGLLLAWKSHWYIGSVSAAYAVVRSGLLSPSVGRTGNRCRLNIKGRCYACFERSGNVRDGVQIWATGTTVKISQRIDLFMSRPRPICYDSR